MACFIAGVILALIGNLFRVELCQHLVGVGAFGKAGEEREEIVPAVPAAQPCARAVSGRGNKVGIIHPVYCYRAANVKHLALPHGVAGACARMGGYLHEFAAHFFHACDLELCRRLVDACQHGAAHCRFDSVAVAAGVDDGGQPVLCQRLNGFSDGLLISKAACVDLKPRTVQRVLKLPRHSVGCRGGEVFHHLSRLQIAALQNVLQSRGECFRHRQPCGGVDVVVCRQRFQCRLAKELHKLLFAFPGRCGQRLQGV